jgi:hypothetical protein
MMFAVISVFQKPSFAVDMGGAINNSKVLRCAHFRSRLRQVLCLSRFQV